MEQQNISYFSQEIDHGQSNGNSQDQFHTGQVEFHSSGSNHNFHVSNERAFHQGNAGGRRTTFVSTNNAQVQPRQQHIVVQQNPGSMSQKIATIPAGSSGQQTVHVQLVPQGNSPATSQQQHIIISAQPLQSTTPNSESDGNPITAFMEYFVEQQQPGCSSSMPKVVPQYRTPPALETNYTVKGKVLAGYDKFADKAEKDAVKRARQAEAARQRYHRLTAEEKKSLNLKRTLAQKRKKQREKEMAQLEAILRASGDIYDDPEVLEQLREKRMRAKWAEAARNRYQRSKMSEDERRSHNMKRRQKQVAIKTEETGKETPLDDDSLRRIREQNVKKAEAARQRYHRMSTEEKKMYNQRRTEAFRRRRMEEEALLAMPIGRINGEALDRAQQIVIRNAKRAEAARLRYQRMTPEQRRAYNQKRYTVPLQPKRKRQMVDSMMGDSDGEEVMKLESKTEGEEEFDALSSLERDVLRRTQQAQQALLRQRAHQQTQQQQQGGNVQQSLSGRSHQQQIIMQSQPGTSSEGIPQQIQYVTTTSGPGTSGGTRILMSGNQQQQQSPHVTYIPHHQRA